MPRLRDVLPEAFEQDRVAAPAARSLADVRVVAVRLATGAPCARHAGLFAPWPGPERHVTAWYILENHKAVGVAEDPERGVSFPVAELRGER